MELLNTHFSPRRSICVYFVYFFSQRNVFDYQENDVYWCTADAGWITGHSYVVYGPLINGCTGIIFEGKEDVLTWRIIQ